MKWNTPCVKLDSPFWNETNILAKEAFPLEEYLAPEGEYALERPKQLLFSFL